MNNYTKHIGIVTNYIDNKYSITVDNKTIHMPFEIMHKLSVFPPSVMDGDHLEIGAQITLARRMRESSILTVTPTEPRDRKQEATQMVPTCSRMQNPLSKTSASRRW